jgi:hypothetical protein
LRPSSASGIEEIQDALDNLCHRTDFVGIGFQLAYCWRADSLATGGCAHRTGLQFADWSAKQSLIAADIPQYLRPFQNAIIFPVRCQVKEPLIKSVIRAIVDSNCR